MGDKVKALEEIVVGSPVADSLPREEVRNGLQTCAEYCAIDGLSPIEQHRKLSEAEQRLNAVRREDPVGNAHATVALSFLYRFHTELFKHQEDELRGCFKNVNVKAFDILYYSGRLNFQAPIDNPAFPVHGFHEEAYDVYERALVQWSRVPRSANPLMYQLGRVARINFELHRILLPDDSRYLDSAVKALQIASSGYFVKRRDFAEVVNCCHSMLNWIKRQHDDGLDFVRQKTTNALQTVLARERKMYSSGR